VAALPDFQVGAVRKRQPYAQQNFVGGEGRHIDLFDAQIFAAVEYRGRHLRRHRDSRYSCFHFFAYFRLLWRRRAHSCVIKIFRDSTVGLAASSKPSWILANGNRCVTISITGSFFCSTRFAAPSWMSIAAL